MNWNHYVTSATQPYIIAYSTIFCIFFYKELQQLVNMLTYKLAYNNSSYQQLRTSTNLLSLALYKAFDVIMWNIPLRNNDNFDIEHRLGKIRPLFCDELSRNSIDYTKNTALPKPYSSILQSPQGKKQLNRYKRTMGWLQCIANYSFRYILFGIWRHRRKQLCWTVPNCKHFNMGAGNSCVDKSSMLGSFITWTGW